MNQHQSECGLSHNSKGKAEIGSVTVGAASSESCSAPTAELCHTLNTVGVLHEHGGLGVIATIASSTKN
jgi:hypothetical protein